MQPPGDIYCPNCGSCEGFRVPIHGTAVVSGQGWKWEDGKPAPTMWCDIEILGMDAGEDEVVRFQCEECEEFYALDELRRGCAHPACDDPADAGWGVETKGALTAPALCFYHTHHPETDPKEDEGDG